MLSIVAALFSLRSGPNILLGLKLSDDARLSEFRNGTQTVYEYNLLDPFSLRLDDADSIRIDCSGSVMAAQGIIKQLGGKILFSETIDDIVIFYAYTPRLPKHQTIHSKKVNLMTAVHNTTISIGYPYLDGSY